MKRPIQWEFAHAYLPQILVHTFFSARITPWCLGQLYRNLISRGRANQPPFSLQSRLLLCLPEITRFKLISVYAELIHWGLLLPLFCGDTIFPTTVTLFLPGKTHFGDVPYHEEKSLTFVKSSEKTLTF